MSMFILFLENALSFEQCASSLMHAMRKLGERKSSRFLRKTARTLRFLWRAFSYLLAAVSVMKLKQEGDANGSGNALKVSRLLGSSLLLCFLSSSLMLGHLPSYTLVAGGDLWARISFYLSITV